jgi:rare lipoprotein A
MEAMTCAHRSLPFGTRIRVQNLDNGRSTTLTVNDRGPFVEGRIVDVSRRGARGLAMLGSGIARVRITVVG